MVFCSPRVVRRCPQRPHSVLTTANARHAACGTQVFLSFLSETSHVSRIPRNGCKFLELYFAGEDSDFRRMTVAGCCSRQTWGSLISLQLFIQRRDVTVKKIRVIGELFVTVDDQS
jgi:hypothetical protein